MKNLRVALAQISPVWLNKSRILEKIKNNVSRAGKQECDLEIFRKGLFVQTLDIKQVLEKRQNFDCAGHYSRPDITRFTVNSDSLSLVQMNSFKTSLITCNF